MLLFSQYQVIQKHKLANQFKDYVNQKIIEKKEKYDYKRLGRMVTVGTMYMAPMLNFWYGYGIPWMNMKLSVYALPKITKNIIKLSIDQLIFSIILRTGMFTSFNLLNKKKWNDNLKEKVWQATQMSWKIWPFAQFINFQFIPSSHSMAFMNSIFLLKIIHSAKIHYSGFSKVAAIKPLTEEKEKKN
eukprot:TRINITY_DN5782_c0_g1_i1.p1 TRINITY_DN5782_c0_g1~~TRINITY_DN5782_c0_g1_i1.p1  ORF type:complete len:187 (-),score=18.28 TRINITY_DN5782_c0_g1_i1:34-594(-)